MKMATEVFKVQVIFPHFLQIFLQRKSTCSSFDTFKKILVQRYGFLQWNPLKVEWYDTDGDKIRIYNEDDWGIYMELNGTKVNVQIDNHWIYSAKTSFTNVYTDLPTPLRIQRQSTVGNEPRKHSENEVASKSVTEEKEESSSGSNQTAKYDGVQSMEYESDLSKQPKTVDINSQKRTSVPPLMRLPTPTSPIPIPTPTYSKYIHFGTSCNSCLGEIRGYRYKCNECPNYDLCSKCQMQKLHKEHQMIGLDDPSADTDHDPRFWKATLNKYESKNVNEEEDNQENNSSINQTPRKQWITKAARKNVNEDENNSGSNETAKYEEVQSEVRESDLPHEQTIVENQSEKSASVLQPIEQLPLMTTKSIEGSIGISEPSTVNDFVQYDNSKKTENNSAVTTDCPCPPAVTSDSSRVVSAESTVTETLATDIIGNDVRSDLNYADPFLNKCFDSFSTLNVNTNKSNLNITDIKKSESNTDKPTMFVGKSNDKTADCDQGWGKSNNTKSKLTSHPEFRFWKDPPVTNVHHHQPQSNASKPTMFAGKSTDVPENWDQYCGKSNNTNSELASQPEYEFWKIPAVTNVHHRNPRINQSILQMISMGYSNSGGWLSQLMEKTNGNVVAALDLLEVND